MKRIALYASIAVAFFLSLFLMYSQKIHDTVQLWKRYNIVYISTGYTESDIYSLLLSDGAEGIISRENSHFEVRNNMLPTLKPYANEGFTSESIRSFFFNDESAAYFLFYVPEESLEQVIMTLNKEKIAYGIDATAEYPVLCPILCFAAFILLMLINRIDFTKALCLLPVLAVSYAVPFYSVAASICCFLFIFCIADIYDSREGALHAILKKAALYLVTAAGIASICFSGLKASLLMCAGIASSAIIFYLRWLIIKTKKDSCHFQPVNIITARWIDSGRRYNLKTLLSLAATCSCFLILSFLSGFTGPGIKTQDLLLPSPSEYTEQEGFTASAYDEISGKHAVGRNPDLTDFLNEKWYAETAPYRKVNTTYKTAAGGEKVTLPSFTETDGYIIENDQVLFTFDDAYVTSATDGFAEREGIEKLLVSQDSFFSTDYASTGKIEVSPLNIPAVAICVSCFIILAVVYLLKRHKK